MVNDGYTFSSFQQIIRAQLAPDRIDAVIAAIIAQATSRNVPLLWWTGPQPNPLIWASIWKDMVFLVKVNSPAWRLF